MLILKENPEWAISSKDLCEILEATPQTVNQALRSLEDKGLIERGLIRDENSGQMVAHVMEVSYARKVQEKVEKDKE